LFADRNDPPNREHNDDKNKNDGQKQPQYGFVFSGFNVLELLTLPSRHLVWTVALNTLRLAGYPEAWPGQKAFFEGASQAVTSVYETLVASEHRALAGLIEGDLLERLRQDSEDSGREKWQSPPVLKDAKIIGILWAQAQASSSSAAPCINVSVAVFTCEEYNYPDHTVLLRRLQRWTFERAIEDEGSWQVVGISSEPWFWPRIASGGSL